MINQHKTRFPFAALPLLASVGPFAAVAFHSQSSEIVRAARGVEPTTSIEKMTPPAAEKDDTLLPPHHRDSHVSLVPETILPVRIPRSASRNGGSEVEITFSPRLMPVQCLQLHAMDASSGVTWTRLKDSNSDAVEHLLSYDRGTSFGRMQLSGPPDSVSVAEALVAMLGSGGPVTLTFPARKGEQSKDALPTSVPEPLSVSLDLLTRDSVETSFFNLFALAQADGSRFYAQESPNQGEKAVQGENAPRFDIVFLDSDKEEGSPTVLMKSVSTHERLSDQALTSALSTLREIAPLLIVQDPRQAEGVSPVIWVSSRGKDSDLHAKLLTQLAGRSLFYAIEDGRHPQLVFSVGARQDSGRWDLVEFARFAAERINAQDVSVSEDTLKSLPPDWLTNLSDRLPQAPLK